MTDKKHTQGQWHQRRMNNAACTEIYVNKPDFKRIGVVYGTNHVDQKTEKYDANLIAAAPELLEALEDILAKSIEYHVATNSQEVIKARAAIAKAKGQDQ